MLKNALNGLIRVIGTGENHWPLVYDRDLADLYVRVAAMPQASGSITRTTKATKPSMPSSRASSVICRCRPMCGTCRSKKRRKKLGAYADALALDQRVRGPRARALGWSPTLHSVGTNVPRLLEEFRRAQERAA